MPRKPSLTFAGALRILGKYEPEAVGKLDKVLGGTILAAGAAAVIGGGAAFVPAALLAAVWGWVDQKNEATGLLRGLVGKLSDRMAGIRGVARRDLIIAAHSTIVAAAFFEVLEEHLGALRMRELAVTDAERRFLTIGAGKHNTQDYYDSLYWSVIPCPSPSCGFQENLSNLAGWVDDATARTRDFLSGLTAGAGADTVHSTIFREQVLDRYQSHYLELAEKAPEFVFWAMLGEHAATRHRLEAVSTYVQAVLQFQGQALAQIQVLLGLVSDRSAEIGRQREGLRSANVGVLAKLIVPSDTERYDTDVVFPTIERAFVTPHYRMAAHDKDSRIADEDWWSERSVARDLELMLAAYFTSADSTSVPMLLLGHPGAGKSILTKVLAARLPPEEYTVVRVPLRSVSAGAPIAAQIQQALDIASNNRLQWQALSDQDTVLVVLLDGLDELLQAADFDRSEYLREVMDFQRIEGEQNRPVSVIVTSRTVVADRVDVPDGATVVKLDEFDEDQVAAWLNEWRATNLRAIQSGTVRELTAAEALHQADLAKQPLLLLMLALYAADPKSPQLDAVLSKSALYERIFDSFARREVRKHAVGRLRPQELENCVSDQVFRLAIAALAMFNRGVQSVRETDLRSDLTALTGRTNLPDDEGARLLGEFFFVHAPEAIMRTQERAYEFLHATFGEYLVAQHGVGELAALANAAYGGRYQERTPNDEVLFALLSHHAWAARPSVGDFAKEIFAALSPDEQEHIRRALLDLLGSFRQRRRSTEFDGYRPTPLDFVRQLAAYSANLTTLSILFSDPEVGFPLVGAFGDDEAEALANWRSMLSLWRSGLDHDSWLALLSSLNLKDNATLVDHPPLFKSFELPGADEYWSARVAGDDLHASRIRRGLALVDGAEFYNQGPGWADEALAWLQARLFSPRVLHDRSHLLFDPPENASDADVVSVGEALVLVLRVRAHALTQQFVTKALQRLVEYPDTFKISPNTVLAVAYECPEVLLRVPRFRDRDFYVGVQDALHAVLDHGTRTLRPDLRPEWEVLRTRLLGKGVPVHYFDDPLRDVLSRF
ncbi:NACHT domain-containing protein [Amycolatopsis umgeniensis]|uniref:Energy-coupling factor transporter ATP-binding protein EcfA2 n=1 Tax=Amycolatopsis umgeniensis TaxID=336628 RepID=A0A841BAK3_9PSEU|nr:NACHT domain-containing protein [Amycolatopsis umgeniensis]MBB5855668.1 energy-coupling factor transporter ATP-binding protein EcfA2 [Amycolatopsis umgeniensis]